MGTLFCTPGGLGGGGSYTLTASAYCVQDPSMYGNWWQCGADIHAGSRGWSPPRPGGWETGSQLNLFLKTRSWLLNQMHF
jgi:hypothetical protein